ncbi:gp53-like domain-containing protein [Morganella morganii]|uniref:gp53-like domain-containing protein n=1 Tax=Morganella morganii TaxID=582 RepID=UPI001967C0BB|nr:hypothetical protein [Morganella morganii]QSB90830.1 hypothetical protein JW297_00400 [Morganella morganii]
MKKIGDVTSTADKNGEWTNGNVAAGIAPTILEAGWLNSVQREILGVLVEAGIAQDKNNDNQLKEAIKKIISGGNYATKTEVNSKLAKDQNGADIPNKDTFIKNLGLEEKLNTKLDKNDVVSQIGYSNEKVMDQRIVTNELAKRLLISDVVNEAGLSTEKVMNQRAVTEELSQRPTKNDVNNSITAINDELAKKGNKNTALKSSRGWYKDESTGMIMQWGDWSVGEGGGGEVTVNFAIPFPFSGVVSAISVNDAAAQMVGYSLIGKTSMKVIKGSNDDRGRSGQYIVWGW